MLCRGEQTSFPDGAGSGVEAEPPLPKRKAHYLSNADLLVELRLSKRSGQITPRLAQMFMLLAERYSRHRWFAGYSFREDLAAEAVIVLCTAALKFNLRRKNPFAYFSTVAYHALGRARDKEHKQARIKGALRGDGVCEDDWDNGSPQLAEELIEMEADA